MRSDDTDDLGSFAPDPREPDPDVPENLADGYLISSPTRTNQSAADPPNTLAR
jgi:hypothetical protein